MNRYPKNTAEGDHETPQDFFDLLNRRFRFKIDLAAWGFNAKRPLFFSKSASETGSLGINWHNYKGWLWLNPPYKTMRPWALKCREEMDKGAQIVMLSPAALGSKWFREICACHCRVWVVSARLKFSGHATGIAVDTMLTIWSKRYRGPKFALFYWPENKVIPLV